MQHHIGSHMPSLSPPHSVQHHFQQFGIHEHSNRKMKPSSLDAHWRNHAVAQNLRKLSWLPAIIAASQRVSQPPNTPDTLPGTYSSCRCCQQRLFSVASSPIRRCCESQRQYQRCGTCHDNSHALPAQVLWVPVVCHCLGQISRNSPTP